MPVSNGRTMDTMQRCEELGLSAFFFMPQWRWSSVRLLRWQSSWARSSLLRTFFVRRYTATVHRGGLCLAAILKPNCGLRWTRRIKQREIFEVVRYERGQFDQFVIVGRRIVLKLADRYAHGLLFAQTDSNSAEYKCQHADRKAIPFHSTHARPASFSPTTTTSNDLDWHT